MTTATLPAVPRDHAGDAAVRTRAIMAVGDALERRIAGHDPGQTYKSGSRTDQNIGLWRPPLTSVHEDLRSAELIRRRARDLVRNHPTARQAVRISRQGTIGNRLRLKLGIDHVFLGLDRREAHVWETEAERLWEQYAHGASAWVDAGRRLNFTALMQLVHDADFIDGEALIAVEWREMGKWQTCFQAVDIDRLSTPPTAQESVSMRSGVALGALNEPIGYHIRNAHPNDMTLGANGWLWTFHRRETDWGRPVMLHTFDTLRAGQTRGMSEFATVISAMRMSSEYGEAELAAAIMRASFVAVIKSKSDWKEAMQSLGLDPNKLGEGGDLSDAQADMALDRLAKLAEYYNEAKITIGGQKVVHLPDGDELDIKSPSTAGAGLREFQKSYQHLAAAGLGVDPVGITQDYEGVNYSSGKMSMHNNFRGYLARRTRLCDQIATPMMGSFLEEAIYSGALKMPPNTTLEDFPAAKDALMRCKWITAGQPMLEPLKERQAQQLGMNINLDTLESILAEEGETVEDVLDQRMREQEMLRERGLDPASMMGLVAPPEPAEDDKPKNEPKDKGKKKDARSGASLH
jgi:lambda family phage portal protein